MGRADPKRTNFSYSGQLSVLKLDSKFHTVSSPLQWLLNFYHVMSSTSVTFAFLCRIILEEKQDGESLVILQDLSLNGMFINGKSTKGTKCLLQNNYEIGFGSPTKKCVSGVVWCGVLFSADSVYGIQFISLNLFTFAVSFLSIVIWKFHIFSLYNSYGVLCI